MGRSQQMCARLVTAPKSEAVREQAILALLSERTNAKTAAKCGVNARTLHRWLTKDEAFKSAYAEARQATFQAGMSRVQALTARAIDTLEDSAPAALAIAAPYCDCSSS